MQNLHLTSEESTPLVIRHDVATATPRGSNRRLLLGGALIAAALIVAIAVQQGVFLLTTNFSFIADNAQNIAEGQAVRSSGQRIGAVSRVTSKDDGKVHVTLAIYSRDLVFVTHEALIELRKEGSVGTPYLEIIPGKDLSRLAAPEARLSFSRADGMETRHQK